MDLTAPDAMVTNQVYLLTAQLEAGRAQPSANQTLVEATAKAHRWQQLESGEYPSFEGLAHAVGVDRTYVGRMLSLTGLAPDIIEAILRGDEPDGLSLEKLRKSLSVRCHPQKNSSPRES